MGNDGVHVTKHGERRIRERCGGNKKSVDKMAEKALERGLKREELIGDLRKWADSYYYQTENKGTRVRIYNNKLWIFKHNILITVLSIPGNLHKNVENAIKKKKANEKKIS